MIATDSPARAGRYRSRLTIAFALVLIVMVAEAITGWLTGSLALLSDAGHMATDALGLGMALAAIVAAGRVGASRAHTYGLYRMEILAALANAVLLFAVAAYVMVEAVQRLGSPPDIATRPMLVVAAIGLVVNIVAWSLLRSGAETSLNLEGAYLEVLADLIASIGVLCAALAIDLTGWTIIDPLVGAAIGAFILPRAWRLGARAVRVLVQAAPRHLDLEEATLRLGSIPGVLDVHDLHVWTLTSGKDVATAHVMTDEHVDPHPVLDEASAVLESMGVAHATLQVEPQSHTGCTEINW